MKVENSFFFFQTSGQTLDIPYIYGALFTLHIVTEEVYEVCMVTGRSARSVQEEEEELKHYLENFIKEEKQLKFIHTSTYAQ